MLALTSLTSDGHSVGIVHLQTEAMETFVVVVYDLNSTSSSLRFLSNGLLFNPFSVQTRVSTSEQPVLYIRDQVSYPSKSAGKNSVYSLWVSIFQRRGQLILSRLRRKVTEMLRLTSQCSWVYLHAPVNGFPLNLILWHAVAQLVEALCYRPESIGFRSSW
jgi:hypothetical protein